MSCDFDVKFLNDFIAKVQLSVTCRALSIAAKLRALKVILEQTDLASKIPACFEDKI